MDCILMFFSQIETKLQQLTLSDSQLRGLASGFIEAGAGVIVSLFVAAFIERSLTISMIFQGLFTVFIMWYIGINLTKKIKTDDEL